MTKKNLMVFIAESSNFCCVWRMLDHYKSMSSDELAAHLGVDKRLVYRWRKWVAQKYILPCKKCRDTD